MIVSTSATIGAMRLAIGVCLVGVVGLGLWPRPLLDAAEAAAADLMGEPVALSIAP